MSDAVIQAKVVVVGAGPAGIAATCAAAESGASVALLDQQAAPGGRIWRQGAGKSHEPAGPWLQRLAKSGAAVHANTAVFAEAQGGLLLARRGDQPVAVQWDTLVLAVGASELFLPFPGWTLPGVVGVAGLQALLKGGYPVAGKRVAVGGSGPQLLATAVAARLAGAHVVVVAEQARRWNLAGLAWELAQLSPGNMGRGAWDLAQLVGSPYRCGTWVSGAAGDHAIRRVRLSNGRNTWEVPCDLLACAWGLAPGIELPQLLGCSADGGAVQVDEYQATSEPDIYCAGEVTGPCGVEGALIQGLIAGYAAAGAVTKAQAQFGLRARYKSVAKAMARAFQPRVELKTMAGPDTVICRCEDVTLSALHGHHGWDSARVHTRCGMGLCQGRVCAPALRFTLGWGSPSVRPPITPVPVSVLALKGE